MDFRSQDVAASRKILELQRVKALASVSLQAYFAGPEHPLAVGLNHKDAVRLIRFHGHGHANRRGLRVVTTVKPYFHDVRRTHGDRVCGHESGEGDMPDVHGPFIGRVTAVQQEYRYC